MRKIKIVILITLIVFTGCNQNDNDNPEYVLEIPDNSEEDVVYEVEESSDDVKTDLDLLLAEIRYNNKSASNSEVLLTSNKEIEGESKNKPEFEYNDYINIFTEVRRYLKEELKISEPDGRYYYIAECIDPRMSAIYDDEDKGVANGYINQNIFIAEYETKKENEYSYLVLVRENSDSEWKIIHDGKSYKTEE